MIKLEKLEKIIREFVKENGPRFPKSVSNFPFPRVNFEHAGVQISAMPDGYKAFVTTSDRKRPIHIFTSESLGFKS